MGKYITCFLGNTNEVTNLAEYEKYFVLYSADDWRAGSGDAVFTYSDQNGDEALLFIVENPNFGISLRYDRRVAGDTKDRSWFSIGNPAKIPEVVDASDDVFVPLGSFLSPLGAWEVVKGFFSTPLNLPAEVKWIDAESDTICWNY